MIMRGKSLGTERTKGLTEFQLEIYERAKKEGWFEKVKTENVVLRIKHGVSVKGVLADIRKVFPNNYVGKENSSKGWLYTIYAGDKEYNKMMNETLIFDDAKLSMKGCMEELRKALKK